MKNLILALLVAVMTLSSFQFMQMAADPGTAIQFTESKNDGGNGGTLIP